MAEVRDFLMPDLGEGLTEGEVVSWLVAVGDSVRVDQPVAEVSTEKAVVEVPTPFAGTVVALHGAAGDVIKVGTPLISIDVEAGATAKPDGGSGNVLVGYGTNESEGATRRARGTRDGAAAVDAAASSSVAVPPASPLVRRLAAERGIDLASLTGTGPGGIVTRADLERVPAHSAEPLAADGGAGEGTTRRKLVGVDRVSAERLTRAHQEVPTATAWATADASALLDVRARLDSANAGVHVTPFALLLRLCVQVLSAFPRLNAHFDAQSNEIVLFDAVHLGVAVQTERGLVVPVIRDAQAIPVTQLAAELERTAAAARAGDLPAGALSGSTFTVSNFGAFGVDGGTAIINPPEAAILGVGRIVQRPWVLNGAVTPRPVVELSLVFDHRVADGAVAGGFVRRLIDVIEQPQGLLDDN